MERPPSNWRYAPSNLLMSAVYITGILGLTVVSFAMICLFQPNHN